MSQSGAGTGAAPAAVWPRALAWLALLGPFFFASYGFTNWVSAQRQVATAVVFDWERAIPFIPWTILPYWSIDLLYGASFFLCRDRDEVNRHGLRLLTAQLVSIACFLLFPLRYTFERPATSGWSGALFDLLLGFDLPYNQAPALHISLLVILWVRYAPLLRGPLGWPGHAWFALIGVSVLTTYQHHFIDLPTGVLVGLLCLWLWPEQGKPVLARRELAGGRRRQLALRYVAVAMACAAVAAILGGTALWLLWATVATLLVASCYAFVGPAGFRKQGERHALETRLLLAPYSLAAWLNSRWWTRRHPAPDAIADGVFIGRMPTRREMKAYGFSAMVDLCAELPAPAGSWRHYGLPWLDLVAPDARELRAAASAIEAARGHGGSVLVCCALGYSRSAAAVAAWLLHSGRAKDVDEAIAAVAAGRPGVVLGAEHRRALLELAAGTRS